MSNETKQTAMQMAITHYKKLSEEGSNQAYVIAKFLEENFLEMEREQMIQFAIKCMFNSDDIGSNLKNHFIKKYNEELGGNK